MIFLRQTEIVTSAASFRVRSAKLVLDCSFSSCSKRSLSKAIVRFTLSSEMSTAGDAIDEEDEDDKEDEDEMSMVDLASSACLTIAGIPVLVNKGINCQDHEHGCHIWHDHYHNYHISDEHDNHDGHLTR